MLHPGRTIRIHLLGRPRLSDDETALKFRAPARALSLLTYLLLHRAMPLTRDAVAFALWPDDVEADARANLRRHLFYLVNDALPASSGEVPWILADKRTVQWNPAAPAWCDLAEFQRCAADSATAAEAAALYGGDLLEGFDDEWLVAPRERLREQQIHLLLNLIAECRARGDLAAAISYARTLLAVDPWREDGIRALIALRHATGDRAGALATYRDFVKRLDDELGVAPMAETTAEFQRVANATEVNGSIDVAAVAPFVDGEEAPFAATPSWRTPESISNTEAIRPTPSFTGREDELGAIDAALWSGEGIAAVHGLGGIGKSALVREYARRNRERYAAVWLLHAETETGIIDGLVRLGSQFVPGLDKAQDRRAAAEHVTANLLGGFGKPVLLIFDNLDDERLMRQWMPHAAAHLLATSRHAAWGGDVTPIRVDAWPLDETVRYLRRAIARADLSDDDLERIAKTLGSLPLALAHAAAYLKDTRNVTARRYLDRLHEHLANAPKGADYERAVFATFQEAIIKAEHEVPGAAALLLFASSFAPEAIPEELFHQPASVYGEELTPLLPESSAPALDLRSAASDPDRADDALGALHRLSLVVFAPDSRTYTVHRLVRTAARRLMSGDGRDWQLSSVGAAEAAFPNVEFATWPRCQRVLPHARAALDALTDASGVAQAAQLATRCGHYLAKRAAFADAEEVLRRGVAIAESCHPDYPDIALNLNALAGLLRDTNRSVEAEPLLRRALAICEAEFGPRHPNLAIVLNDLGILVHYANRLDEAESLFRRALAIDEEAYGSDHPAVAIRRHNLAVVLHETNRLSEAEPLFRRALAIDEASLGEHHPDVATDLCSLAWLLFARGETAEAEPLLSRAVTIREAAYGDEHPSYAFALNDLGVLMHDTGRFDRAEPFYRRALAICEASFGAEHPIVAAQLNNLAELLADTDRRSDAEALYRRALATDEASYGSGHPNVARDLNNLAGLLAATGRADEAALLVQRALRIVEASYAPDHPRVRIVRDNAAATEGRWRNVRRSPSRGLRE